jgi:hypothetical protein
MSARQAQSLMEPVGKALAEREEKVLTALFEQASHKHTSREEQKELLLPKSIDRLYIEMDGIMERLRRGTVEMEVSEQTRKGDVYREIKVGAIFQAERGRERCELARDIWVDTPLDALLPLRTCVLNQTYDEFWAGQHRLVAWPPTTNSYTPPLSFTCFPVIAVFRRNRGVPRCAGTEQYVILKRRHPCHHRNWGRCGERSVRFMLFPPLSPFHVVVPIERRKGQQASRVCDA